jgi:ribosomal protein S27AE
MTRERARFCPFCGEPVGSFFGRHGDDLSTWCERCQEWFRAERCEDHDDREPERQQ